VLKRLAVDVIRLNNEEVAIFFTTTTSVHCYFTPQMTVTRKSTATSRRFASRLVSHKYEQLQGRHVTTVSRAQVATFAYSSLTQT
jgi:hypothetical protein